MQIEACLVPETENKTNQSKISKKLLHRKNSCTSATYLFAYTVLPNWDAISSLYPAEIRCEHSLCIESIQANIKQTRSVCIFTNQQTRIPIIRTTRNNVFDSLRFPEYSLYKAHSPEIYSGILSFKLGYTLCLFVPPW
jgi:hypothetical protein